MKTIIKEIQLDEIDIFNENKTENMSDFITSGTVKNMYFIQCKNDSSLFLHPLKETRGTIQYVLKKGTMGAAIWTKKNAKGFIKGGSEPLKMVLVSDVDKFKESKLHILLEFIEDLEVKEFNDYSYDETKAFNLAVSMIKSRTKLLIRKKS